MLRFRGSVLIVVLLGVALHLHRTPDHEPNEATDNCSNDRSLEQKIERHNRVVLENEQYGSADSGPI